MLKHNFIVTKSNGKTINGVIWLPEETPKAVLQIAHGMTEHIYRYQEFAKDLTAAGIAVAGYDLPGHGNNLASSKCASFGEEGWENAVKDIQEFSNYLQQKYSDVPHFILGFSLGSFLVREYLNRYDHPFSGAIIAGTGQQPAFILWIMMAIIKTQINANGFDDTTPLVKKLSFETYNSKFKPNSTDFDWLCSDRDLLQEYMDDDLCADSISSGLFWQLLNSMKYTGSKNAYSDWDSNLPILLLSGKEDPVGNFGKGVVRVEGSMKRAGISNVSLQLIPNARHDVFHEVTSGASVQITKIIINWIKTFTIYEGKVQKLHHYIDGGAK